MRIRRRLAAAVVGAALLATSAPASADISIGSAERRPYGTCIIIPIFNWAICY